MESNISHHSSLSWKSNKQQFPLPILGSCILFSALDNAASATGVALLDDASARTWVGLLHDAAAGAWVGFLHDAAAAAWVCFDCHCGMIAVC